MYNYSAGIAFLTTGVIAKQTTAVIYGDAYSTNNEADAFRHTYWNALLSNMVGKEVAKLLTDAHEYGTPNNFTGEFLLGTRMDFFNNRVGIDIGANTEGYYIMQEVLNFLENGKLVKINNGQIVTTKEQ